MKDNSLKTQYERYVCTIDTAQRLYSCGYNFPSMFFWIANPQLDTLTLYRSDMQYFGPMEHRFPAPNAMELKERFPDEVWVTTKSKSLIRRKGLFYFTKYNGRNIVSLMISSAETGQTYELHREEDVNEAEACGRMLAYVFENHLDQISP